MFGRRGWWVGSSVALVLASASPAWATQPLQDFLERAQTQNFDVRESNATERQRGSEADAVLVDFPEQFIRVGRVAVPVMMMTWSNPEQPGCLERGPDRSLRYRRVIAALTRFFALEFESGRLRAGDPEVLARMFMGSLHHFVMVEVFAGGPVGKLSAAEFAGEVVDVLLRSAALVAPARAALRRRKPA